MPAVTLTFDNGPDPDATPKILDVLAQRDIRSTFFVVGRQLGRDEGGSLARRAHGEGHWIGNHTFTHSGPLGEAPGPLAAKDEIVLTEELIGDLAHPDRLFRPVGGGGNLDKRLLTKAVADHLIERRYTCVLWNAVPRDWSDPDGWVERALAQCRAREWTLLVLHDVPGGAMERLDEFLGRAADEGFTFRQEFPPDCVPMRAGRVLTPLDQYLSAEEDAAGD